MIAWAAEALDQAVRDYGAFAVAVAGFGFFFGGFVKGIIGFALPLIAVTIAAMVLPAGAAVAYLTVPTAATNIWQSVRHGWGAAFHAIRSFRLFITVMVVTLLAATQLLPFLSERAFAGIVGGCALFYSAAQLAGWRPRAKRPAADIAVGAVAGFFGGVSGVWGPPTLMLLLALNLSKQEYMRSSGVIFLIGSIPFAIGHIRTGVLTAESATVSALFLLPAALGMWLGQRVQDRLDGEAVRKLILIALLLAGLNFMRRAFFG